MFSVHRQAVQLLSIFISFLCWLFPGVLLLFCPCLPAEGVRKLFFCYVLTTGKVWLRGLCGWFRNLYTISDGISGAYAHLLSCFSLDSDCSGLGACLFGKTGYSPSVQGKLLEKRGWRGKRLEKSFSRMMGDGLWDAAVTVHFCLEEERGMKDSYNLFLSSCFPEFLCYIYIFFFVNRSIHVS